MSVGTSSTGRSTWSCARSSPTTRTLLHEYGPPGQGVGLGGLGGRGRRRLLVATRSMHHAQEATARVSRTARFRMHAATEEAADTPKAGRGMVLPRCRICTTVTWMSTPFSASRPWRGEPMRVQSKIKHGNAVREWLEHRGGSRGLTSSGCTAASCAAAGRAGSRWVPAGGSSAGRGRRCPRLQRRRVHQHLEAEQQESAVSAAEHPQRLRMHWACTEPVRDIRAPCRAVRQFFSAEE